MKTIRSLRYLAWLLVAATPAFAADTPPDHPIARIKWLALAVIVFVDALFLLCLFFVSATLKKDAKWSLAAALAENITWPTVAPAAPITSIVPPALGAAGLQGSAAPAATAVANPASATAATSVANAQVEPSASRLIAFVGMLAVVMVFMGMSNCVLWHCFTGDHATMDTTEMLKFLAGGSALFVPYAVNQFRSAFEAFGATEKK